MRVGLTEIILIVIIALALIKPDKLLEYSRAVGKALRYIKENKEKIDDEVIEPARKAVEPITQPVKDIQNELTSTIDDIKTELNVSNKGNGSRINLNKNIDDIENR